MVHLYSKIFAVLQIFVEYKLYSSRYIFWFCAYYPFGIFYDIFTLTIAFIFIIYYSYFSPYTSYFISIFIIVFSIINFFIEVILSLNNEKSNSSLLELISLTYLMLTKLKNFENNISIHRTKDVVWPTV